MKSRNLILSVAGLVGGLALITFEAGMAIEPPPDTATPPTGLLRDAGGSDAPQRAPRLQAAAELPFLGLSTAALPDFLADHVGLEKGEGVIVRAVVPGSPAAEAGIAANDVIFKVNDTIVDEPETLTYLVREKKIGDTLSIELIQRGKRTSAEVTLVERPADLLSEVAPAPIPEPLPEGLPRDHADRLRGLMERNLGGMEDLGGFGELFSDQHFEDVFRRMRERIDGLMPGLEFNLQETQPREGIHQQSSTVRVMDHEGSIELKSLDGNTDVVVRDTAGEVLWSGPWNTEEDKTAAPQDIRDRIDKINVEQSGFNLRFNQRKPGTIDN